jgi:hypothetical protein
MTAPQSARPKIIELKQKFAQLDESYCKGGKTTITQQPGPVNSRVTIKKDPTWSLFADELAKLQPTPSYMRLLRESVLQIWKARKASVREEIASAERAAKAIQDKLDRLDEAFLFERSIDIDTYDRHAEKLREELTLVRIERHSGQLEELDLEGILAFAERVLPRAAEL